MKDHEGYDYCDRCKQFLGYAYPSNFCHTCQRLREREDNALLLAASIIRSRDTWDFGGPGQADLELLLADRFNMRQSTRTKPLATPPLTGRTT